MGLSRILVVEDTAFSRVLLERQISQMGYEVITAKDGVEAWEILQRETINFVITDWLMPNLDGIELVERVRQSEFSRYIYVILLTTKGDKSDLIRGMEAGADDFMIKPVHPAELKVKIHCGERVLKYEKTLMERHRELQEANSELNRTYSEIKENLKLAGEFQKALLPKKAALLSGVLFETLFVPCEFVAGDMFNYFFINEETIVFYLLDVAGHGIPAAMMSFTLSHLITPLQIPSGDQPKREADFLDFNDPVGMAGDLNRRFHDRSDDQQYFTMIYGKINLSAQNIAFIQAGHPPLIHLPTAGEAVQLGDGGFPLGIFPDVEHEAQELKYGAGDRLILYSDGVTDCRDPANKPYSLQRLMALVNQTRDRSLGKVLQLISKDLRKWRQSEQFEDDLSLLALEFG